MDKVFIVNTITDWYEPPRARHQVAESLSKNYKVYFVSANKIGFAKLDIIPINERMNVLLPSWPIDYRMRYRLPVINEIYQDWLFNKIKRLLDNKDITVINFDFTATHLVNFFQRNIYFCNDYNIRYYYVSAIKSYFERCEKQVAERALCCAATSKYLVSHLKAYNSNVIEIKLGAPFIQEIPKFNRGNKIRVGIVGFLHENRTPLNIIEKIVRDTNVELVIYGKLSDALSKAFKKYNNIKYNGVLTGNRLLEKLKNIDVGIAPYNQSDVNRGGTPNKLWIYLALGKPVVVTRLPMITDWKFDEKYAYLADDEDEFIKNVYTAYNEDTADLQIKRHQFAQENTWDKRVEGLLKYINECMDNCKY